MVDVPLGYRDVAERPRAVADLIELAAGAGYDFVGLRLRDV